MNIRPGTVCYTSEQNILMFPAREILLLAEN